MTHQLPAIVEPDALAGAPRTDICKEHNTTSQEDQCGSWNS